MSALVRYDAACHALAEAKSVDEVKDVRDKAEAMRAYARQAKNKALETDAAEIRIRAERRLGQLIEEQKRTVGLATGGEHGGKRALDGSRSEPSNVRPTLADAGIDKKLSSRAQKLAAVPEAKFDGMVKEWRGRIEKENERVTTRLLKAGEVASVAAREATKPDGKFDVIIIDPPWPMQKIEREVRPNQVAFDYPTMTEDELLKFADTVAGLADQDCHLFMWTTQRFLPFALALIDAYGFRYVLTMVWHKPGGFQPIGLPQYNCEFCIYARRGSPTFVDTKQFNCCFEAPRREHSRKPDEFYDTVRRVTIGRRVDVFSREARDGFAQFGNEADKFSTEAA